MWTRLALGLALVAGFAGAQATLRPANVDAGLLLELLGAGAAHEVVLPEEVTHVYLVGMHRGDAVLSADRRVGRARSLDVTAGVLMDVRDCPLLVFGRLTLLDSDGRVAAGNQSRSCWEQQDIATASLGPPPLPFSVARAGGESVVPLDRWLPITGATPGGPGGTNEEGAPDPREHLVFSIFLATRELDGVPAAPTFSTWDEVRDALDPEE